MNLLKFYDILVKKKSKSFVLGMSKVDFHVFDADAGIKMIIICLFMMSIFGHRWNSIENGIKKHVSQIQQSKSIRKQKYDFSFDTPVMHKNKHQCRISHTQFIKIVKYWTVDGWAYQVAQSQSRSRICTFCTIKMICFNMPKNVVVFFFLTSVWVFYLMFNDYVKDLFLCFTMLFCFLIIFFSLPLEIII